jgi:GNAT superfamily N-acetyltransferase
MMSRDARRRVGHVGRALLGCVLACAALAACVPGPTRAGAAAGPVTPATAAAWQTMWDQLPYRGDGNWSTPLPDGRSLWVTGDAIPRAGGAWASNTVTVVDGGGAWQTVDPIPDAAGVKTWLGPTAVARGRVLVLTSRIRPTPGVWPGFASVGTGIATMRVGAGARSPVVERVTATPWSPTGIAWTAGLYVAGDTVHVFGVRDTPDSPWGFDVHVATVPAAAVHDFARWRVFGRPILRAAAGQGTDSAFTVRRDAAGWHVYTRRGGRDGGEHGEYVAGRIDGTYTWRGRGTEPGYLPAAHPEVRLASGRGLVSVNVDGAGPRFLEVTR